MIPTVRKALLVGALALAAALIPTMAAAQNDTRTFTVFNYSHYRIDHMYVSPHGYRTWGSDWLGRNYLYPNQRADMSVARIKYDVMLVDQDRDICVVPNVDFRYGESWTITDDVLVLCEIVSEN